MRTSGVCGTQKNRFFKASKIGRFLIRHGVRFASAMPPSPTGKANRVVHDTVPPFFGTDTDAQFYTIVSPTRS